MDSAAALIDNPYAAQFGSLLSLPHRMRNSRSLLTIICIINMGLTSIAQSAAKRPAGASARSVVFQLVPSSGIKFPPHDVLDLADLRKPIPTSSYSLDYARAKLLPAMGGSIAVGDFDHDGHPDLYVVVPGETNHLLQNNGNGTFTDVTDKARVPGRGSDLSAVFVDYDHSGHLSVLVAGLGGITVYHNNGDGTFTDLTQKAGFKPEANKIQACVVPLATGQEGYPDLLVGSYTDLSAPPSKSSFIFPNNFPAGEIRFYRNRHDGTFEDATEAAGLAANPGRTRKILTSDFNNDGRMDFLVLRDDKPPVLYLKQGNGAFLDHTADAGEDILVYAFFDGHAADFNHDGKMDLALWSSVGNRVLLNQGGGSFEEVSMPVITEPPSPFGFRGMVADLTGNGSSDILSADAHDKWHLLQNHQGHFEEIPFSLSSSARVGSKLPNDSGNAASSTYPPHLFSYITGIQSSKHGPIQLIALTRDGQLLIFERLSMQAPRAQDSRRRGKP